jgi:2-amino-4-hydroxy-6-hydroxymethyldihydropteridine diphosphokinase
VVECYVGLGSNVGDRIGMIKRALACIASRPGVTLREASDLYLTPAWGYVDQRDFVNGVCRLETHLGPRELLAALKEIEVGLGRRWRNRWGPREIDLDILFYGDRIFDDGNLRIPHPMICRRAFVLVPLSNIAPDLIHPETGLKISEHLSAMAEQGEIECRSLHT